MIKIYIKTQLFNEFETPVVQVRNIYKYIGQIRSNSMPFSFAGVLAIFGIPKLELPVCWVYVSVF